VIRPGDSSWQDGLGRRSRWATMLLSWPLSLRYGYRRRPEAIVAETRATAGTAARDRHR
jgi:hypothetical protein